MSRFFAMPSPLCCLSCVLLVGLLSHQRLSVVVLVECLHVDEDAKHSLPDVARYDVVKRNELGIDGPHHVKDLVFDILQLNRGMPIVNKSLHC